MATLAELRQANTPATVNPEIALAKPGYESGASFESLQRIGKMFASSALVPAHFRGPQHIGDACIALEMAFKMKASPMTVFQNMYLVQGKPGWSTQFLIACFNQTGRFSSIRYEFEGKEGTDGWGCRASATELATGDKVKGALVTIGIAKKEGWFSKNGSKWQTMPEQMLRYRAAAWFIRTVAPEVAMGMYTVDELRDIERANSVQYTQTGPNSYEPVEEPAQAPRRRKAAVKKEEPIETAQEIIDDLSPAANKAWDLIADTPLENIELPIAYVQNALQCDRKKALEEVTADAVADVMELVKPIPLPQLKEKNVQEKADLLLPLQKAFGINASVLADTFRVSMQGRSAKSEDELLNFLLSNQAYLIETVETALSK